MADSSSDPIQDRKIKYSWPDDIHFPSEAAFRFLRMAYELAEAFESELKKGKIESCDDPEKKVVSVCLDYAVWNSPTFRVAFKTPKDVQSKTHTCITVFRNRQHPWRFGLDQSVMFPFTEKKADKDHKWGKEGAVNEPSEDPKPGEEDDDDDEDDWNTVKVYDLKTINEELRKWRGNGGVYDPLPNAPYWNEHGC